MHQYILFTYVAKSYISIGLHHYFRWHKPPHCLYAKSLQWRHNERDGVSNHQPHHCLVNGLFRHRSKKTSKLRVTALCARNPPVAGEIPARRASNAESVSMRWRHHDTVVSVLHSSLKQSAVKFFPISGCLQSIILARGYQSYPHCRQRWCPWWRHHISTLSKLFSFVSFHHKRYIIRTKMWSFLCC